MNTMSSSSDLSPKSPLSQHSRRRVKTPSSLSGMFSSPEDEQQRLRSSSTSSMDSLPEGDTKSERQELASMALNLRRAKRKLFLKSVERPTSSVDQLREILLQVSVDALEGGDRPGLDVKDGSFRRHERTASFD